MATLRATPEADEIVSEIQIAAPAEQVFEAITNPKQVGEMVGTDRNL